MGARRERATAMQGLGAACVLGSPSVTKRSVDVTTGDLRSKSSMSDVVHIYGSSYETCPTCGHKCPYDGAKGASEPIIRLSDWQIELNCPQHGKFVVRAGNLIQPNEYFFK